ncbi:hypothetical protein FDH86_gp096 [Arthrobacter phage Tank]|uniref:Uncharacterized protein n=2 Tax=Tankvirus tank TaxID=1982567 RepID=A0A0U4IYM3_9CAUD|nr:hypothetical protein FDH86_gp096 [Arthrobacter phage Tank]ALY10631.1 hypothetical protein TANK_96 [Arthrobacter phage Tank]ALY10881.1 hypothetical protein WILDE_99 [Arthrobacter phage Wilde]
MTIINSSAPQSSTILGIDRVNDDYLIEITSSGGAKAISVNAEALEKVVLDQHKLAAWNSRVSLGWDPTAPTQPWTTPISGNTVFPCQVDNGVDLNVSFDEDQAHVVQLIVGNQGGQHLRAFVPIVPLTALLQSKVEGLEPVNLTPGQLDIIDELTKKWRKSGNGGIADQLLAALNPFTLPTAEYSVIEGENSSEQKISLCLVDGSWIYTSGEEWGEREILAKLTSLRVLRDGI